MGLHQSKEALLHQHVVNGNIEGIKALHQQGANLEWFDDEGRTPLIVACMKPQLYDAAKTLIQLGANVNALRPGFHARTALHHAAKNGLEETVKLFLTQGGCHAETALHHAAKEGLERTVKLLLSHGANALAVNGDRQTPLVVARVKGYTNVVRTLESHICFFSGWLRELNGPGFLEAFVPQLLSKKIWVVVVPCSSRNPKKPLKLELAIYTSLQDARPRTTITLSKAKIKAPNFKDSVPVVNIFDKATKTRYKLASSDDGEKQQLQWFCNACRGIPQVMHPKTPPHAHTSVVPLTALPSNAEDVELAMAINASLLSAREEKPPIQNGWLSTGRLAPSEAGSSGWLDNPPVDAYNGWGVPETGISSNITHENSSSVTTNSNPAQENGISVVPVTRVTPGTTSVPSAPPVADSALYGPTNHTSVDSGHAEARVGQMKDDLCISSSCVICLDARVEGACIPCGHMAGCMSCLNEIKAKKWGCPVCRAKIDQVVRLYAV